MVHQKFIPSLRSAISIAALMTASFGAANTAQAENFAAFNCLAGDITYTVDMPTFLPPFVVVTVSVSEAVDPAFNRVIALNRTLNTGGAAAAYKGFDNYDGIVTFSASSSETVKISFADGNAIPCEPATASDRTPSASGGWQDRADQDRADLERTEEDRLYAERLRQLTPLDDVIGYSLGGRMRSQPSREFDSIARVKDGNRVEIIGRTVMEDGGFTWYKVRAGRRTGFMWGGALCYAYERQPGLYGSCRAQGIDVPRQWMVFASDNKSRAREGVHPDRREAQRIALRACGKDCKIIDEGQPLCHAYARSRKSGYWLAVVQGDTRSEVRRRVRDACEERAVEKGTCKIRISTCQE